MKSLAKPMGKIGSYPLSTRTERIRMTLSPGRICNLSQYYFDFRSIRAESVVEGHWVKDVAEVAQMS